MEAKEVGRSETGLCAGFAARIEGSGREGANGFEFEEVEISLLEDEVEKGFAGPIFDDEGGCLPLPNKSAPISRR